MYEESVTDPELFWDKQAERLDWFKKWNNTLEWDYNQGDIRWYEGGKLNVSYNCIDRHLEKKGDQKSLIWESDDPNVDRSYTYKELHTEVSKFANVMKNRGIVKGDRVMIYMPMIPELAIACLACTRIGAVHSVVFGGFSAEALKNRIIDCSGKMLITANAGVRGGKSIPLKQNADQAMENTSTQSCIVVSTHLMSAICSQGGITSIMKIWQTLPRIVPLRKWMQKTHFSYFILPVLQENQRVFYTPLQDTWFTHQ